MRMFLTAALFAASTTAALACLDWQGEPHYGKITPPQGFPNGELFQTLDVRAVCSSSISDCDMARYGYVSEWPDFDVYWGARPPSSPFLPDPMKTRSCWSTGLTGPGISPMMNWSRTHGYLSPTHPKGSTIYGLARFPPVGLWTRCCLLELRASSAVDRARI